LILNVVAYFELSPLNSDLFDEVMTKMSLKLYPDKTQKHAHLETRQNRSSEQQKTKRRTADVGSSSPTTRHDETRLTDAEKPTKTPQDLARRKHVWLFEVQARSEA